MNKESFIKFLEENRACSEAKEWCNTQKNLEDIFNCVNWEWWLWLLRKDVNFSDKCPWDKLKGLHWSHLLKILPQFADKCPWDKLDGDAWSYLLQYQPQFSDKCPWDKLDGADWSNLLQDQPQFSDKRPQ